MPETIPPPRPRESRERSRASAYESEHPVPSRPREEVERHVRKLADFRRRPMPDVRVRLGLVGPVEAWRATENVFTPDGPQGAAAEGRVTVVRHPVPGGRAHRDRPAGTAA